ncbi:MAG: sigma-70 family RNA polymerase sigma factor [Bacteroidota bacterium]
MHCDVPQLWLAHKDALRGYIRKRVNDPEQVNDLMQEMLLKVYGFCQSKTGIQNVRSWLLRMAQNAIIDHVRKNKRLVPMAEELNIPQENEEEAYREAVEYILPMIHLLPPTYAEPLRLSDVEGMKQADIARQLNLGLSATKSRIQRAREMLKDLFAECCEMEIDEKGRLLSFDIKPNCRSLQAYKNDVIHASR